ncbi:MAG: SEC-C domain-containing protein [Candidatus Aenigmarchaeota archaeon]|nr:SEC-C domain-containing protein [Candidatus Aenigmarchaeota archaeon]
MNKKEDLVVCACGSGKHYKDCCGVPAKKN